jgi:hypothetical protein
MVKTNSIKVPLPSKPVVLSNAGCQARSDTLSVIGKYLLGSVFFNWSDSLLVSSVVATCKTIAAPSYALLQKYVGVAGANIAYDLEGWEQTPLVEQDDPVGYYALASALAHKNNKLFVGVPGSKFMEGHNAQFAGMAKVCDQWVIQAQRYQGQLGLGADFVAKIKSIIAMVRAGNKTCPIWVQLSTTPGQGTVVYTPEQVIAFKNSICNLCYGVSVFDNGDPYKPATLSAILKLW